MSYSCLYGINKGYKGKVLQEYSNAWLFSPMVWEILEDEYFDEDEYGQKPHILLPPPFSKRNAWLEINAIMNKSEITNERICWELTNQSIFHTKDKSVIADNISLFIATHQNYGNKDIITKEKSYPLRAKHINERFTMIAKDIKNLDENKYPYFFLKNTSCDDSVECWFENGKTLKDLDEHIAEFVNIKDSKIIGFTDVARRLNK